MARMTVKATTATRVTVKMVPLTTFPLPRRRWWNSLLSATMILKTELRRQRHRVYLLHLPPEWCRKAPARVDAGSVPGA